MTRLFIVDDHPVVRLGYRMLLQSCADLRLIGESETGLEAVDRITSERPDLAVVDISLPDISGIELIRRIQRSCPDIPLLMVSNHRGRSSLRLALAAGARGYIIKNRVENFLEKAIDQILEGEIYVCPEMQKKLNDTSVVAS